MSGLEIDIRWPIGETFKERWLQWSLCFIEALQDSQATSKSKLYDMDK